MRADHPTPLTCARCSATLSPGHGDFYVIKILAVADPYPPILSDQDLVEDLERDIQGVLADIRGRSEQELLDEVYRGKILRLCVSCYRKWIENPVGN